MRFAKKSLGQNFLIDANIIKKIVDLVDISKKNVLEIGPGKGALTTEILKRKPKSLILIEKDKNLFKELKIKYKNFKNVEVYEKDILQFNIEKKIKKNTIIFGNLPYNISSQILASIVRFKKHPPNFSDLIFMFQRELAQRIVGKYKTSKYGRLSVLVNYKLKILNDFNISPNCFFPKPKIYSTILHFTYKKKLSHKIQNIKNLEKVTNILFGNRRKMINKNLRKILNVDKLFRIKDLNFSLRPSDLKPETYYKITEILEAN